MHPLNKLKQDGAELVTREELEEALAPIRAALEIDELGEIVLDESGELVEGEDEIPVELDDEEEPTPRRSRKRKPDNVDPLDLVPEPEEEG
jgi:hypothetical protein